MRTLLVIFFVFGSILQAKSTLIANYSYVKETFIQVENSAQSIRHSKDIPKITKKVRRTDSFRFYSFGFGWVLVPFDFVSLKDIDPNLRTGVEQTLLEVFDDVAFCFNGKTIHACYWVKDSEGKIGLIKFDGSILVPPLKGNIHQGNRKSRFFVGEQTVLQDQWIKEYYNRVTHFSGLGLGHFNAVVDNVTDENKICATVPAGQYDDIMLAIKGTKTYYFAAKIFDKEMKWGVLDYEGKEIMPIEAKGIYKKRGAPSWLFGNMGGKWENSEDLDMSQIENMVRNQERIAEQRRASWEATLSALGTMFVQAGSAFSNTQQTMPVQGNDLADGASSKMSGDNLEAQYKEWENRAHRHYDSLTQLGYQIKAKGKDVGGSAEAGMSSNNYVRMKKSLREAQHEMQQIRRKAAQKGIKISKSQYEDISVKY